VNESSLKSLAVTNRNNHGHDLRPKLLVSVRNAAEASAALDGGADWIDLKEPFAGPLGAVGIDTARQVVGNIAGRCPVSAALGELADWNGALDEKLLTVPEIDFVKLGMSRCVKNEDWAVDWLAAEHAVREFGKSLVAVAYADWLQADSPEPEQVLTLITQTVCQYLLIDTFDKNSASTIDLLGSTRLLSLLRLARRKGFRTVVAGGITLAEIPRLPLASIDIVAVRGGVCSGDRRSQVEEKLVEKFNIAMTDRRPR